jgi:hypothetical protein
MVTKKKSTPKKKTAKKKTASKKTATKKKAAQKKTAKKKAPAKKNKLGVENSLVNNIKARQEKGVSRDKSAKTVNKQSYERMQNRWRKD